MKKINWYKIIGNSGTAFFTTMGGIVSYNSLIANTVPINILIPVSLLVSGIHGSLAFFKELSEISILKDEESNIITRCVKSTVDFHRHQTVKILHNMLLW